MIPGKLSRLFTHLRQGSFGDRIAWEWRKRSKQHRSRKWASRIGNRDYFDAKIDRGVRMRLHADSELCRLIYVDDFERTEREFLKAYLKPGDLFVDVGANIGLYSLLAARLVGPSGKVFAFEPTGRIYERLMDCVKLNGFQNMSCFRIALSDRTGSQSFFVSGDGFDAWNSFARPTAGRAFERELIECDTWDRFALAHGLLGRVAMMKLDVEGWETRVLKGAAQTLARVDAPLLQVEFTDAAADAAGSSCKELYRALEQFGYRMFVYDSGKKGLVHDPLRGSYPYTNLIATKSPEEVKHRLRKGTFWKWISSN